MSDGTTRYEWGEGSEIAYLLERFGSNAACEPIVGCSLADASSIVEITLCCKLLKTQGKFRGWEAGIRTPIPWSRASR